MTSGLHSDLKLLYFVIKLTVFNIRNWWNWRQQLMTTACCERAFHLEQNPHYLTSAYHRINVFS